MFFIVIMFLLCFIVLVRCFFKLFFNLVICICKWTLHIYIYSQVHKYWDIDTILTFLALYTTTMDFKWNEQDVL